MRNQLRIWEINELLALISFLKFVNIDFMLALNTLLLPDDARWISGKILYLF